MIIKKLIGFNEADKRKLDEVLELRTSVTKHNEFDKELRKAFPKMREKKADHIKRKITLDELWYIIRWSSVIKELHLVDMDGEGGTLATEVNNIIKLDRADFRAKSIEQLVKTIVHECLHLKPWNFHHFGNKSKSLVYMTAGIAEDMAYIITGNDKPKVKKSPWYYKLRFWRWFR